MDSVRTVTPTALEADATKVTVEHAESVEAEAVELAVVILGTDTPAVHPSMPTLPFTSLPFLLSSTLSLPDTNA